ncbi:MAG: terminase large subunit domain-containing protein [Brachybacterium sp.]
MSLDALDAESRALLKKAEKLGEKDKAELLARLQRKQDPDRRVWFCKRGRSCDGHAHDGAPYEHARSDQWPPKGPNWDYWVYMAGRGAGKTASGSNLMRQFSGRVGRIAAIARTGPDFRHTIVEGESGLITMCERAGETYDWKPALKQFTFENGAKLQGFSGEEPDTLRGPQFGAAWIDEASHIDLIDDVWSNLLYGLRLPGLPGGAKVLITTTPLPNKWTKRIVKDEGTVLTRVSTSKNIQNLDASYRRRVIDPLLGTRQGRQELEGMILEDVDGALWSATMLERRVFVREDFVRILVGVDPAGSQGRKSDLTGIVVVGITADGTMCVLSDVSGKYSPDGWAKAAIKEYDRWEAGAIVVERNFGGDMVKTVLKGAQFSGRILEARASAGKKVRAEPIVGLYEQSKIYHLDGADLADLEDEQVTWIPGQGPSPNRIDAMVWAATYLSGREKISGSVGVPRGTISRGSMKKTTGRPSRKRWN